MSDSRYDRQSRLPQIGVRGQQRIEAATVAIVGCGALGSVAAELLARAGVRHLLLIDRDTVQWSNLQRQFLYTERDARRGVAKADAAARRLKRINSQVATTPVVLDLGPGNILDVLSSADLWVDGTDNFEVRFLMNDASLHLKKPWIHAGCVGTHGQIAIFWPGLTACFRCLVPEAPTVGSTETCDTTGVLGPATTAIAALQCSAALKVLVEGEAAVDGTLHSFDIWMPTFRTVNTGNLRHTGCRACRQGVYDHLNGSITAVPTILCGQNAVQFPPSARTPLDLNGIAVRLASTGPIQKNAFFVRGQAETLKLTVFRDGRIVVEGTQEIARARALVHQLLGG